MELSLEDKKRIDNCNYYQFSKRIIKSASDYSNLEVGSAVFIRYKGAGSGPRQYVSHTAFGPTKMLIIFNDNGFVFAKRIVSDGSLGVEVMCLTISYPSNAYDIEIDDNYVDSILLGGAYDPAQDIKSISKKKNKASRINNKKMIRFNSVKKAEDFFDNIKTGDIFYTASNSYGKKIIEWKVSAITNIKNNTYMSRKCVEHGVVKQIEIELIPQSGFGRRIFYCLDLVNVHGMRNKNLLLFKEKPVCFSEL